MLVNKKAILLVGSPKLSNSASEYIGAYLIKLLCEKGLKTEKMYINQIFRSEEGIDKLLIAINDCDLVIFSTPLYVDSLPYPIIRIMEIIANNRSKIRDRKQKKIFAISNCGFPEAQQNNTALRIYKQFASELDFKWVGSLAIGMGAAIIPPFTTHVDFIFWNLKKILYTISGMLVKIDTVPREAVMMSAKPFVPKLIYVWVATFIGMVVALKNRAYNLTYRPYNSML